MNEIPKVKLEKVTGRALHGRRKRHAEKKGVNEVVLQIQGSKDSKGPLLTETSLYSFSKNSHFGSSPESVKDKNFEVTKLDNLKNRVQMSMFSSSRTKSKFQ